MNLLQRLLCRIPTVKRALDDAYYAGMLTGIDFYPDIADALREKAGAR